MNRLIYRLARRSACIAKQNKEPNTFNNKTNKNLPKGNLEGFFPRPLMMVSAGAVVWTHGKVTKCHLLP
jgi:hypothetical protein